MAAPGVREWWGTPDPPEREREGLRNDGAAFALEVDGELAGWLGFNEESEPDYRHAALDIALAPPYQDRGLGPEALRTAIRWLAEERGHHRFTIDPALAERARDSAPTPRSASGGWGSCGAPSEGRTGAGTTAC